MNHPVRVRVHVHSRRSGCSAGTGTLTLAHVSGKAAADRSSELARGDSTPGGPPCLSPDRLYAHGEGR